MRGKSKHIGGLFMLRSVGDEAVNILLIMGDDRKSLPNELVSNSDHSEFTWLSVLPEPQDCLTLYLEGLRIHLLSVESYEPSVDLVSLDRGEHGSGEVLYLQWVLHADSNSGDIEQVQQHCAIVSSSLHNTVDTTVFWESPDKLLDTSGRVVESADLPAFVSGVSYHKRSFAYVDSNVPHGRSVFSFNDIAYILVLHCKYGFKHLTNYPDSDVKSMGSEPDVLITQIYND